MAHRDNIVLTNLVRDVIDAISAKGCRILSKNEKNGA